MKKDCKCSVSNDEEATEMNFIELHFLSDLLFNSVLKGFRWPTLEVQSAHRSHEWDRVLPYDNA